MGSIYSKAYKEINSKTEMTELEITMAFYFLVSYKEFRTHKVQKKLLNIPLKSIPALSEKKANHYCLYTSRNTEFTNSQCSELDSKLTIREVLENLNKSVSSENSTLHYKWTSTPPSDILIYYDLQPENHIGFVFQGKFDAIEKFVKYCLKKLFEIDTQLSELGKFTKSINETYQYHSPRGNAVKSSDLTYCISGFYINHNLEEIVILNRSSYSSDNWSETYYHLNKEIILKTLLNEEHSSKTLADLSSYGKNLGRDTVLE